MPNHASALSVRVAFCVGIACSAPASASEQRCGWYINPTPGNLWLQDKDALWGITSQVQAEGPDAKGADNAPRFDDKQYVQTQPNGYGYGCACLTVETDAKAKRITEVISGHTTPLARCKADKSLPPPTH